MVALSVPSGDKCMGVCEFRIANLGKHGAWSIEHGVKSGIMENWNYEDKATI